ncbi:hypothetical protein CR513_07971, partial [Mucuna pruriens]
MVRVPSIFLVQFHKASESLIMGQHVPKLTDNLISIHRLIQDWNCVVTFLVELTTGRTIGVAKEHGGLYYLQHTKIELSSSQRATSETLVASQKWFYHKLLRHLPFGLLKTMFPHLFTKESLKSFKCDICQFLKHHRATFSPTNNKSLEPFDLVRFDVWGSVSNSILGAKLRSNNDTEFVNLKFFKFLKDNGMVHELMICVNTPQQNGVIERKNHHDRKSTNKLPTRVLNGISQIKHILFFFPSSPLMLSLPSPVFGCVAFVHSHNPPRGKLDPTAVKCVFIGYLLNKKGFKCYHPLSRQFFVSMDGESYLEVKLVIDILDNSIEEQVQLSEPEVSIIDNFINDVTDDMLIALRKGKRSCAKYPISQFVRTDHLYVQHQSFIVAIDAIKILTSVQEVLKDENRVQAMK